MPARSETRNTARGSAPGAPPSEEPSLWWGGSFKRTAAAVLLVVLVLILAALYMRGGFVSSGNGARRTGRSDESGRADFGTKSRGGPDQFPFYHHIMEPPRDLLARLSSEKPRKRSNYQGHAVALLRREGDRIRVDGIADHYTERLRVTQSPPGTTFPSPWDVWSNASYRTHIQQFANLPPGRDSSDFGTKSTLAYRAKLEELAPPVHDTNPTFVCWILRRLARVMRMETYQMRVMDGNCGWGGQALGACAADVGCYHGYLPFATPLRERLSTQLLQALSESVSPDMPENEFWVRQMAPSMSASGYPLERGGRHYDVLLLHVSDLTPFANTIRGAIDRGAPESGDAWGCVRAGGCVVLFIGPDRRDMSRALAVVHAASSLRTQPQLYGVREFINGEKVFSRALVWTKIEHI